MLQPLPGTPHRPLHFSSLQAPALHETAPFLVTPLLSNPLLFTTYVIETSSAPLGTLIR